MIIRDGRSMGNKNGYFRLVIGDNSTGLELFPPEEGGRALNFKEVQSYLDAKKIEYNLVSLRSAVDSKEHKVIELNKKAYFRVNEEIAMRTSEDKMMLICRFYPPSEGGTLVDEREIAGDMKAQGVRAEILPGAFQMFASNRQYCTDYVFAKGEPPVEGVDGEITYLFNTDLSTKPTVKEDGSVDFYHLNTICACTKGQELAKMRKEVVGKPGRNVLGEAVIPREVKKVQLKYGKNMHVSEDGLTLICDIDGHVNLTGDTVFVSGVLELENIDTSTGNIDNYEGNLLIKGNVTSGFSVHANGDIEIRGVVEGATVTASGQITVARGVNGMGRGLVKAGTNVIVKYVENARIEAGNYVQAETILNSDVTAKTTITVEGKKGLISGSHVRAGQKITAKVIGSEMGSDTVLEVGTDPELKARLTELMKQNEALNQTIKRIQPVLLAIEKRRIAGEKFSPDKVEQTRLLSEQFVNAQKQLGANLAEIQELQEKMKESLDAVIEVSDKAYAGTKLVIAESPMILKTPYQHCRFVRQGGDVSMLPK